MTNLGNRCKNEIVRTHTEMLKQNKIVIFYLFIVDQ